MHKRQGWDTEWTYWDNSMEQGMNPTYYQYHNIYPTHTCTHANRWECTHTDTNARTQTHIYIQHTYTHIHTHIHTHTRPGSSSYVTLSSPYIPSYVAMWMHLCHITSLGSLCNNSPDYRNQTGINWMYMSVYAHAFSLGFSSSADTLLMSTGFVRGCT